MLLLALGCATLRPVTVSVVGAELAPARADGTPWDGPGPEARDALLKLGAAALGPEPFGDTLLGVAGSVAGTLEKPDPLGEARLVSPAGAVSVGLPARSDTFAPAWCAGGAACPTLGPVRLRDVSALEVALRDDDLDDDDPVDVVVLDRKALRRLVRAGATPVDVRDQGHGEVLTLTLVVSTAPAPP